MKDLNKLIDDIFKTIDVSVVPLRIKEISIDVFLSLSWLPEMLLKSATTTAMIGCVVGKNAATVRPWNECNAQLYGLEEQFKVTVHGGQRRVVRRELDVEIHVEEGCRLLATCMYSRNSMHSCLIWIC